MLIQSSHPKLHFYSDCKKFWAVKNSKPVTDKLDQIKTKENVKLISAFDFSTLYTELPHKYLLKVLFDLGLLGYCRGLKKKIIFP